MAIIPNPSNSDAVIIYFEQGNLNTTHYDNLQLSFRNIVGEMVHQEEVFPFQGEIRINVRDWKPGIYLALIYADGKPVGRAKFVVQ